MVALSGSIPETAQNFTYGDELRPVGSRVTWRNASTLAPDRLGAMQLIEDKGAVNERSEALRSKVEFFDRLKIPTNGAALYRVLMTRSWSARK